MVDIKMRAMKGYFFNAYILEGSHGIKKLLSLTYLMKTWLVKPEFNLDNRRKLLCWWPHEKEAVKEIYVWTVQTISQGDHR